MKKIHPAVLGKISVMQADMQLIDASKLAPMFVLTPEATERAMASLKSIMEMQRVSAESLASSLRSVKEVDLLQALAFDFEIGKDMFNFGNSGRYYFTHHEAVPTQEDDREKIERLDKEQRGKTSNKRHKRKVIHQQAEKTASPSSLLMKFVPPPR